MDTTHWRKHEQGERTNWIAIVAFWLVCSAVVGVAYWALVGEKKPVFQAAMFRHDVLWLEKADGHKIKFEVEVALSPEQQALGLMNREGMDEDHGMIFMFDGEQSVTFWMKNTLIPLDMLFLSSNGQIIQIVPNARPMDESLIASEKPVHGVLELNGGATARQGISVGDRIRFPGFVR